MVSILIPRKVREVAGPSDLLGDRGAPSSSVKDLKAAISATHCMCAFHVTKKIVKLVTNCENASVSHQDPVHSCHKNFKNITTGYGPECH